MMTISGKTQVCAVIGDPIKHSLSPVIQNAAFDYLNLDFVFLAFQVKAADLKKSIEGIRRLGIHGLNVTMPHKSAVIECLDEVNSTVKFLGSVNTILNRDGILSGYNTDGIGALNALKENGVAISGKKVLLLGAGGAAKAIAFALVPEVGELTILNRSAKKAESFAETLERKFSPKVVGGKLSPVAIEENLSNSDVLINATSAGMKPSSNQSLVAQQWLRSGLVVMDIVYDPVETKLAKDAKAAGAGVISGVEMLIYQGAASFEIWTGRTAPIEVMRKAALNTLSNMGENK